MIALNQRIISIHGRKSSPKYQGTISDVIVASPIVIGIISINVIDNVFSTYLSLFSFSPCDIKYAARGNKTAQAAVYLPISRFGRNMLRSGMKAMSISTIRRII